VIAAFPAAVERFGLSRGTQGYRPLAGAGA
jgi:hypothetical protein